MNLQLSTQERLFLNELTSKWKQRDVNMDKLSNECWKQFDHNRHLTLLRLVYNAFDYEQGRGNTLSTYINRTLIAGLKDDEELLTVDLQMMSFDVATGNGTCLLSGMVEAYDLKSIANDLISKIRLLLQNQQFTTAVQAITALDLQEYFDYMEVLIPCILQDKSNVAESYLKGHKQIQKSILVFLDPFCSYDKEAVQRLLLQYIHVPNKHPERLQVKQVKKLLARWLKLFKLENELQLPSLIKSKAMGHINFYVNRRYHDHLEYENWRDLVDACLNNNPDLRGHFLGVLASAPFRDVSEAARWVIDHGFDYSIWPEQLKSAVNQNPEGLLGVAQMSYARERVEKEQKRITSINDRVKYLAVPDDIPISLVDTKELLYSCVQILSEESVIGLDAEWGPSFVSTIECADLLQIANRTTVFLIDMVSLKVVLEEVDWIHFMQNVFCNERVTKLGFQLKTDLRNTCNSIPPNAADKMNELNSCLCLQSLAKILYNLNTDILDGIEQQMNHPLVPLNSKEKEQQNGQREQQLEDTVEDDPSASNSQSQVDIGFNFENDSEHPHSFKRPFQLSLSDLCNFFLGKPLKKSMQFADWSRRPLRDELKHYAALDALCLIWIYDQMQNQATKSNIDFDAVCYSAFMSMPRSNKRKNRADRRREEEMSKAACKARQRAELDQMIFDLGNELESVDGETNVRSISQCPSVAVDMMLQGLGKHLRRVGIDCWIPLASHAQADCVEVCKTENRILLTMGASFVQLLKQLPKNKLTCIPHELDAQQQLMWFLRRFNLKINQEDIFSRCMVCNYAEFSILLRHQMLEMGKCDDDNMIASTSIKCDGSSAIIDIKSGVIKNNDRVKDDITVLWRVVPKNVIERYEQFYICIGCGKVYWDGNHLQRYVKKMEFSKSQKTDV